MWAEVVGEVDRSDAGRSSHPVYSAAGIIGVAYFLAFVCYGGTDGLHTPSVGDVPRSCIMAVICVTSVASSVLLAPAFVIRLSPNTALCVAWGSHALYAMANLYPTAATLLPAAVIVGATFPAVAVAQGVYTTALVDRWCGRPGADAGVEEDLRLEGAEVADRSPRLQGRCCTGRTLDDKQRRENVFVFFNSIFVACMAAGSLCGIVVTRLLIGSADDGEDQPVTSLTPAAGALNCSLDGADAGCIAGYDRSSLDATTRIATWAATNSSFVDMLMNQVGGRRSCGVNKCPYVEPVGRARSSSPRTWHALIFVLLCNAVSVVLTALLPTMLSNDVHRSTPSSAALPVLRGQGTPLDDAEPPTDGYRAVGSASRAAAESVRRKTLTTLYLFVDRRLLMLAPTIVVGGLTGSLTVAAFHQSFAGCDSTASMIGHGTAYQRGAFVITSLLAGQLTVHLARRRTVVVVTLLAAVIVVASAFTSQSRSTDRDAALIAAWCVLNGAAAGFLRASVHGIYPALFGRDRLDSALLHAALWDSVGAALAVVVADRLCLVIRAWTLVFAAGAAAVGHAALECVGSGRSPDSNDHRSAGSARSVSAGDQGADRDSLASVCISPNEAGSLSTVTSNRLDVLLHPFANRAYYRPTALQKIC